MTDLPPLTMPSLTWGADKPLRFAAGERARFAQARSMHSQFLVGTEIAVLHAGPFTKEDPRLVEAIGMVNPAPCDYVIRNFTGTLAIVDDWQLEPLTPTAEPPHAEP